MDIVKINGAFDSFLKANNSIKNHTLGNFGTKGISELPPQESYFDYHGIRKKSFGLHHRTLREIAKKVIIIGIIHNARIQQEEPFSKAPAESEEEIGYMLKLRDRDQVPSKGQKKEMKEIEEFVLNCGKDYDSSRDDFHQFSKKFMRDNLTIDQVAISIGRNRRGEILEYRLLDSGTIHPVIESIYNKNRSIGRMKPIKYVQIYDEKIYAEFTEDDLIFDFSNPRSDLRYVNFGYSFEEQAIDTITSFLYATRYNKDFFDKSSQPVGFVSFETGNEIQSSQQAFEALRKEWEVMFRGIEGMWKTGFMGSKAKWNPIRPANKDLEFNQYIQILSSWLFALYGMDAAEVGLKLNQSQSALFENVESKLSYSLDRGLKHHLSFKERIMNRILWMNPEWRKYKFVNTGIEKKDQKTEMDIDRTKMETFLTVNEYRASRDLKPIDSGDIILNPTFLQAMQSAQMEEGQEDNLEEEDINFEDTDSVFDWNENQEQETVEKSREIKFDIGNLLQ